MAVSKNLAQHFDINYSCGFSTEVEHLCSQWIQ